MSQGEGHQDFVMLRWGITKNGLGNTALDINYKHILLQNILISSVYEHYTTKYNSHIFVKMVQVDVRLK